MTNYNTKQQTSSDPLAPETIHGGSESTFAVVGMWIYAAIDLIIYLGAINVLHSVFERIVISILGIMYTMKIAENTYDDVKNHTDPSFGTGRKLLAMYSMVLVQWIMMAVLLYTIFVSGGAFGA